MATRGRAPVRVGSAYLDIFPKLNQAAVSKMRSDLARQLRAAGLQATAAFSAAIGKGFSDIAAQSGKTARTAGKAVDREARATSNRLRQIERSLTVSHNAEAGRRLHTIRNLARQRDRLEASTAQAGLQRLQAQRAGEKALGDEIRRSRASQAAVARQVASEERLAQREISEAVRSRTAAERTAQQQASAEIRKRLAQERLAHQVGMQATRQRLDQERLAHQEVNQATRQRLAQEKLANQEMVQSSRNRISLEKTAQAEATQAVRQRAQAEKLAQTEAAAALRKRVADERLAQQEASAALTKRVAEERLAQREAAAASQQRIAQEKLAHREAAEAARLRWAQDKLAQREAAEALRHRIAEEKLLTREAVEGARQRMTQEKLVQQEALHGIRKRMAEEKLAHSARMAQLKSELIGLQQIRSGFLETIRLNKARMAGFGSTHASVLGKAGGHWKTMGQHVETFGTNMEQLGRSINYNLLAPLGLAAGAAAKIGIQTADKQFYTSEGLARAGFDTKQVATHLKSIQQFAVKTPFSLNEMTDQLNKNARNFQSYGYTASESLGKAETLIRGISDSAASFGTFDPNKVKNAMLAADTLLDLGKLNARNLRMFSQGTGIPINELGKIAGFKGEGDFRKAVSDPKGGVKSKEFFDKFLQWYGTAPNVKGSAEHLGVTSVGGKFQAVKEQAQLKLGELFGHLDEVTGVFHRTKLGDKFYKLAERFEQLINNKDFMDLAGSLMGRLARAIELVISGIETILRFMQDHPLIKDIFVKVAKLIAVLGPLATVIGLSTRLFGKLVKGLSPLATAIGGIFKGLRGATRIFRQIGAGFGGTAKGAGGFLQAYRQRRQQFHGGDDRSLARKGWDRLRGKDSRKEKLKLDTEAAERGLKDVERKIAQVRTSIQNLNKEKLDLLANEFGGESGTTIKAQGKDADRVVDELKKSVNTLNTEKLDALSNEFGGESGTSIKAGCKDAEHAIKALKVELQSLNQEKLNLLANEFGGESGTSIKAQAKDADTAIDQLKLSIQALNQEKLNALAAEFGGEAGTSIKAQATDAGLKIDELKLAIQTLDQEKLNTLANEIGGEAGTSIKAQAADAVTKLESLKLTLQELDQLKLNNLAGELGGEAGSSLKAQASDADQAVDALKRSLTALNQVKLNAVAAELGGEKGTSVKAQARDADKMTDGLKRSLQALNQVRLNQVAGELGGEKGSSVKAQARDAERAVDRLKKALTELNNRSLSAIKGQFSSSLSPAIKTAHTNATSLDSKIREIGSKNVSGLIGSVNSLAGALANAEGKAAGLRDRVNEVNSATAGGGGIGGGGHKTGGSRLSSLFSSKKSSKGGNPFKARGGVLPGYQPNVDSIPAILSPGEAVLRPEITRLLGAPLINYWNEMAFRGRLKRHARGGSGGGGRMWPLNILDEIREIIDVLPGVNAFRSGMDMMHAATDIGGTIGANVRGWASQAGGDAAGRLVNDRFGKVLSFVTNRLPEFLTRAPSGIGQIIGLAAGAIAPTAGQRFWEDVWKGEGNILQRGGRFALNMVKSIPQIIKDLLSNIWEVGKSLVKLAWEFIKDPVGFIKDKVMGAVQQLKDTFKGMIDQISEMVRLLKAIWQDPSGAAKEMLEHVVERVKELMPNTKGLFDFARGGIVPGYSPGNDTVPAMLSPGEAVLRPEIVRKLGRRVVRSLNDGNLPETSPKSAGDAADKTLDPLPLPDTEAYDAAVEQIRKKLEELRSEYSDVGAQIKAALDATTADHQAMATAVTAALTSMSQAHQTAVAQIKASIEDLGKALQAHDAASRTVWTSVTNTVKTAIDSGIKPAEQRWIQHLQGPLTQATKTFQASSQSAWTAISTHVASSVTNMMSSFAKLRADLENVRRIFETGATRIREVWTSAMSHVASATRSTVSGPYNRGVVPMMAGMAKLAGTSAPLHAVGGFARGGVVPGYQPNVDSVPALLSKGEGILRPEVVRILGKETILRWNEHARKTGHLYARGGVVGPIGWSGTTGGGWVDQNKDKDFDSYMKAFQAGFKAVVQPMLNRLEQSFGVLGTIQKLSFQKVQPWLEKWVKWVDDHVFSGGGEVVKRAFQEYKAHGGSQIGTKYSGGVVEAWCADFISWCVDKAGANAAYGNSPRGTPGNRWAAVVTWVESMKNHVPTSQSRPGDLMVYSGRHSSGWDHINLKVSKTSTIGGNEGNSVRHSSSYWQRATKALRPSGGVSRPGEVVFNPWPGSVPKYDGPLGGGVDHGVSSNWTGAIAEAMRLTGVSGDEWMRGMAVIIQRESSGNPRDINLYDSNAQRGDPSRGLAQVIGETFREHHQPGTSWDIYDPVANLSASINYIRRRYGHISRVQQANPNLPAKGYWRGVKSASPGMALVGEYGPELVRFQGGERVYSHKETRDVLGKRYEIHIHEAKSEDTTQAVIRGLKYIETMYGTV